MGSQSGRSSKKEFIKSQPSTTIPVSAEQTKKQQAEDIFRTTGKVPRYDGRNRVFYVTEA